MDATIINTVVGIIGTVFCIIGIIVGIIGLKNVNLAIKIKNSINADVVQQAQIIHNGLDDYAVIRLSRDTSKEELEKVIGSLKPAIWEEIDDIVTEKVKTTDHELQKLKTEIDSIPRFDIHLEKDESGGSTLFINSQENSEIDNYVQEKVEKYVDERIATNEEILEMLNDI